jgi:hypothetical protein
MKILTVIFFQPVTSTSLRPDIHLSIVFSNILNLCVCVCEREKERERGRDTKFHTHAKKKTGKITAKKPSENLICS